jgi:hypothetical protein
VALPQSLLSLVERHGCFTGTYSSQYTVHVCLDPAAPPVLMLYASCEDCLGFKVGALLSVLPPGTTVYSLADQLTLHMRTERGFRLSIGGYHTAGGGFWLGAAYYDCGIFLLDGSRNPGQAFDLDLLMTAFRHRILPMPDPRMSDPKLYATTTVYLDYSSSPVHVLGKQDVLSSPQCSASPKPGFRRATLAEFLPLTTGAHAPNLPPGPPAGPPTLPALSRVPAPAPSPPLPAVLPPRPQAPGPQGLKPTSPAPPPARVRPGELCPVCGAEVRERELFSSTFVGCLC